METILYILMGKLSLFHSGIRVHLQQRWDFFKHKVPKLTDLDSFQLPRLFSEQQGLDAAQGKESQQSSVTMQYVGAVLTTRRAGCRAVISVLKRQ